MIIIKDDKTVPDKIRLLQFALKAKKDLSPLYSVTFDINRSEYSREEATTKAAALTSLIDKTDQKEIPTLAASVDVITIIDKTTTEILEVEYLPDGKTILKYWHPVLTNEDKEDLEKGKPFLFKFLDQILPDTGKLATSIMSNVKIYDFLLNQVDEGPRKEIKLSNLLKRSLPNFRKELTELPASQEGNFVYLTFRDLTSQQFSKLVDALKQDVDTICKADISDSDKKRFENLFENFKNQRNKPSPLSFFAEPLPSILGPEEKKSKPTHELTEEDITIISQDLGQSTEEKSEEESYEHITETDITKPKHIRYTPVDLHRINLGYFAKEGYEFKTNIRRYALPDNGVFESGANSALGVTHPELIYTIYEKNGKRVALFTPVADVDFRNYPEAILAGEQAAKAAPYADIEKARETAKSDKAREMYAKKQLTSLTSLTTVLKIFAEERKADSDPQNYCDKMIIPLTEAGEAGASSIQWEKRHWVLLYIIYNKKLSTYTATLYDSKSRGDWLTDPLNFLINVKSYPLTHIELALTQLPCKFNYPVFLGHQGLLNHIDCGPYSIGYAQRLRKGDPLPTGSFAIVDGILEQHQKVKSQGYAIEAGWLPHAIDRDGREIWEAGKDTLSPLSRRLIDEYAREKAETAKKSTYGRKW